MKFSNGKQQSSKRLAGLGFKFSFLFTTTVFAQAEPPGGDPETFPWLLIPILLVFLAAIFFWFGRSIYGRKSCAVGAVRYRTFVGVVFPPTAENPVSDEPSGAALKALRAYSWITFDVPVAVLGPGVTEVAKRKVGSARVWSQIKRANNAVKDYKQTDRGVDIVAKLSCEMGTPSLISGNYWKKHVQLIRLIPVDVSESPSDAPEEGGWNPALAQDSVWVANKLPMIVESALALSGEGKKQGSV